MAISGLLEALGDIGAILTGGHFIYTSGKHGSAYVNKDAVYPHTLLVSGICENIAKHLADLKPEVVAGPAVGGVILSQWTAYHLSQMLHYRVAGVYAERREYAIFKADQNETWYDLAGKRERFSPGEELVVKESAFVLKRGYDKLVEGKRVLVVEDVITTGGTVKKIVRAVRERGGTVVGIGALCNRGQINAMDFGITGAAPQLYSELVLPLEAWPENECKLCAQNVPINTNVGKGREFLSRRGK